jgi:hypothetical protein
VLKVTVRGEEKNRKRLKQEAISDLPDSHREGLLSANISMSASSSRSSKMDGGTGPLRGKPVVFVSPMVPLLRDARYRRPLGCARDRGVGGLNRT